MFGFELLKLISPIKHLLEHLCMSTIFIGVLCYMPAVL